MTNTYMRAGTHDPGDDSVGEKRPVRGQLQRWAGGHHQWQVRVLDTRPTLVEDGKITAPVKGATLIDNGPETMQKVAMIGHDLALDDGVGICGKDGQSVPVGVGQPSLLISELTVGGTQAG